MVPWRSTHAPRTDPRFPSAGRCSSGKSLLSYPLGVVHREFESPSQARERLGAFAAWLSGCCRRHTSSAQGTNFFISECISGSNQANCRSTTPLFHVDPSGCPFIAQSSTGFFDAAPSRKPSKSVGLHGIERQVSSSSLGTTNSSIASRDSCVTSEESAYVDTRGAMKSSAIASMRLR
ncbi:MAG: hypothetical protein ACI841_001825 [Planctomycetota bacterium]|jgi:hypothetical protein